MNIQIDGEDQIYFPQEEAYYVRTLMNKCALYPSRAVFKKELENKFDSGLKALPGESLRCFRGRGRMGVELYYCTLIARRMSNENGDSDRTGCFKPYESECFEIALEVIARRFSISIEVLVRQTARYFRMTEEEVRKAIPAAVRAKKLQQLGIDRNEEGAMELYEQLEAIEGRLFD